MDLDGEVIMVESKAPILKDLLVVELASVLAGPSVGQWLAELGATVIKVENHKRGGDVTRSWKLPTEAAEEDRSSYFTAVNWGKLSIGLDLSCAEGKALLHRLVTQADIVLASYKPGDATKLQTDAETLRALNPRLIYADITAYGHDDPRPGYDAIIQAEAGFTFMNGTPDGPPVKLPLAFMDVLAAHHLREAILLALLKRHQTGRGEHVSTSLITAGLSSLANQATNYLVAGHIPQRIGSEHPNIVPYGTTYPCKDGRLVVLAVGNDVQFERLCGVLGMDELAVDERFRHNAGRVKRRKELHALLGEGIARVERDDLLAELAKLKVPAGAVNDMSDALSLPQAAPLKLQGPELAGLRTAAISGIAMQAGLSEPPHLCQHSSEVLARFLKMESGAIAELRENGTVG